MEPAYVKVNFQVLTQITRRLPRESYLNGLVVFPWGLERDNSVYADIHQLCAFLWRVERLQRAEKTHVSIRSGH